MGQVTKDTLEHMRKGALTGDPEKQFPLTCNEVLQLVHLAGLGLECGNLRVEESWYPQYVVYQDVGDDGCGNGTMRQDEHSTPYLDVALEYYKSSGKCDGIYILQEHGDREERGIAYFEELLDIAKNIWDVKTLHQVLAVRPDLLAKLPERMPRLKHPVSRDEKGRRLNPNRAPLDLRLGIDDSSILPATHDPL